VSAPVRASRWPVHAIVQVDMRIINLRCLETWEKIRLKVYLESIILWTVALTCTSEPQHDARYRAECGGDFSGVKIQVSI
jgi:hypothetical protein